MKTRHHHQRVRKCWVNQLSYYMAKQNTHPLSTKHRPLPLSPSARKCDAVHQSEVDSWIISFIFYLLSWQRYGWLRHPLHGRKQNCHNRSPANHLLLEKSCGASKGEDARLREINNICIKFFIFFIYFDHLLK